MNRRAARWPIHPSFTPRLHPWIPWGVALAETERNLRGSATAAVMANRAIMKAMREARK